jgi:hypothetical protein
MDVPSLSIVYKEKIILLEKFKLYKGGEEEDRREAKASSASNENHQRKDG